MAGALPSTVAAILEKAAVDNGFDLELPAEGPWLGFGSTSAPMRLWLTRVEHDRAVAAMSSLDVGRSLGEFGVEVATPRPAGAAVALQVADVTALHRLLRRAWQLARTLPDEPLIAFRKQTDVLPRITEAERLVIQRVGQALYRDRLIEYWQGRCAMTGLSVPPLLRASHIKPWAACDDDAERLDVFNGLLLAPHLDAAFDCGLISVDDDGRVAISPSLDESARRLIGLTDPLRVDRLRAQHRSYLPWHREKIFRR